MMEDFLIAPNKPLCVIIAGSRNYPFIDYINGGADGVARAVAASGLKIGTVISGGARGADAAGEMWAYVNNIPVEVFPADWDTHGKKAGILRNAEMAKHADALIALWDGKSRGTRDMIERMAKKPTCIYWEKKWDAEELNDITR